jgi:lipopolysaccharide export system permease protein
VFKLNTIIGRYVLKELIPPFVLTLFFLTFVFLMAKLLKITDMVVNYNVGIWDITKMILFTLPNFLEFVLPMSVMIAVLLAFMRMSGDNEIIALKSSGMNQWSILPPVIVFCLVGTVMTAGISILALPWGRASIRNLTMEILSENIDIGIKERTFNDDFADVTLYVTRVDLKNKTLMDVFIEDQRKKGVTTTILAPRGVLSNDSSQKIAYLRLFDGTLNQVDQVNRQANAIHFSTYDVRLDLKAAQGQQEEKQKARKEMSLSELRSQIFASNGVGAAYYPFLLTYHQKISVPFACVALGILAVPLGILSSGGRRRSLGLGLGLIFFLLYYVLLSGGKVFGETGIYPPLIAMWMPNWIMMGIGIYLFNATNKDSVALIPDFKMMFAKRWRAKSKPSASNIRTPGR